MIRCLAIGLLVLSALAAQGMTTVAADRLVYTGIVINGGNIDGVNLSGRTATVSIEFKSGLTALDQTFELGPLVAATYTFSGAGSFDVDMPEEDLHFGSVALELCFYDPDFDPVSNPLTMLSGTAAGRLGFDPIDGETMAEFFAREGVDNSIAFTQVANFSMLTTHVGTLNDGTSTVTANVSGREGSAVTLTWLPTETPIETMSWGQVKSRF